MKLSNKISIIIPVYNSEAYFDRCIGSVLEQSYPNLEVIVVNDGSKGDIDQRIKHYLEADDRVSYLKHEKNEGLFRARITGIKAAAGSYIAFLDSDDYVSYDYYRTLLARGEETQADIIIGKTVWENENGRFVYNYHDSCFQFELLRGDEIQEAYFSQEASCYSWHTVWNKLYRKTLIDRCLPFLESIHRHIVMTEDLCFSSVFFYEAQLVARAEEEAYFYCANEQASTNTTKITMQKFEKNVEDMKCVFDVVSQYLERKGAQERILEHFRRAKLHYARMWQNLLNTAFSKPERKVGQKYLDCFCADIPMERLSDDFFYESLQTPWKGALEYFKQRIGQGTEQYISFDLFDTLVQRPFYQPEDLFLLLDTKFHRLSGSSVSFSKMRQLGERQARAALAARRPMEQDITLTEIYAAIGEIYSLGPEILREMQEEEKRLEVGFSTIRKSGRSIFQFAKAIGKKIFIITDMYLERPAIENILQKNGYSGYERVYISSEERRLKYNGDLFRCVFRDIPEAEKNILHVGDSWNSDIEGSKKAGIESIFLPKAIEVFENKIKDCCTNSCATLDCKAMGGMIAIERTPKNLGYRTMKALVAHQYFDDPYRPFRADSDMNSDPYFIGYYAVGMHLLGLCKWIDREVQKSGCKTVHFLSRDGYLPMQAYRYYREISHTHVRLSYLQTSRKSLMPMIVKTPENFFQLPVEYRAHSPRTLLRLLSFAAKELPEQQAAAIWKKYHIVPERRFEDEMDYAKFIRCFLREFYSEEKHQNAQGALRKYFAQIKQGDIAFDMGYSGRIQAAISDACGRSVDVLFVHEDYDSSIQMKDYAGFQISSFYDYRPAVSGLFREQMLSEYCGSCVGYRSEGEKVLPMIEENDKTACDCCVIKNIQRGALEFVRDFTGLMAKNALFMDFSSIEASYPFEGLMKGASLTDLQIFRASYFEDDVWGAQKFINIEDYLRQQLAELNRKEKAETAAAESGEIRQETILELMNRKSKLVRALLWLLIDPRKFKEKARKNLCRR